MSDSFLPKNRRAYSAAELATLLGVATDSVYRAVKRGQLKRLAGFGKFMFSETELQRFLNQTK
jgi:nucleoid DNA-binding protein